jgi:hypothetical protein
MDTPPTISRLRLLLCPARGFLKVLVTRQLEAWIVGCLI